MASGDTARLTGRRRLVVALLAAHVLMPVVLMLQPGYGRDRVARGNDIARYLELGRARGIPGRDFRSEYPPLAVLGMRAVAHGGLRKLVIRDTVVQLAADLLVALAVLVTGGELALLAYLALTAMLMPFLVREFELLAVAAAFIAIAVSGRRPRLGGFLLAASAFLKPFSLVLVPVFAVQRRWRALGAAVASLAGGGLVWLVVSGPRGPIDVATYRGSRGWHAESTPGLLLALLRGLRSHYENGTYRVGRPPAALGALVMLAVLGALVWWWWSGRALRTRADDLLALGAIAILLAGSTLFSPQFVAWLLPFTALVAARGAWRSAAASAGVVAVTTLRIATAPLYDPDGAWVRTLLVVRVTLLAVLLRALVVDRRAASAAAPHPAPARSTTRA